VDAITKRNIAFICTMTFVVAAIHYDTTPVLFWILVPAFLVSFFLYFRFYNEVRKGEGQGPATSGIIRFLIRIVLSLFIAAGVIVALCLFVYLLHYHAPK
jgi:hypothetical protein